MAGGGNPGFDLRMDGLKRVAKVRQLALTCRTLGPSVPRRDPDAIRREQSEPQLVDGAGVIDHVDGTHLAVTVAGEQVEPMSAAPG
jgi:hypothetical protein